MDAPTTRDRTEPALLHVLGARRSHGPHHIFKEWADKYKGKFDKGWDALREDIFARQKALGWTPADAKLTPRASTMAGWDSVPEDERPFQRRLMELFAGMTEHADTQAGRLITELDRLGISGQHDRYLYSWRQWLQFGRPVRDDQRTARSERHSYRVKDHIRTLNELGGMDVLGGPKTDNMYHAGWAWAGSTPFQGTKLNASHFGGTRTPMAVSWPKSIKTDKTVRAQFHHVNDIVPTLYDVIGIKAPKTVDGVTQDPMDGVSMKYSFANAKAPGQKKTQYFEVMGDRAIYNDGWIAAAWGPRIPWVAGLPANIGWSPEKDAWLLYNLNTDFSEATDLAAKRTKKTGRDEEAVRQPGAHQQGVPGRWWFVVGLIYSPHPQNPATEFDYTQDVVGIPEPAGPKLGARSSRVVIDTEIKPNSAGCLCARRFLRWLGHVGGQGQARVSNTICSRSNVP